MVRHVWTSLDILFLGGCGAQDVARVIWRDFGLLWVVMACSKFKMP